MLFNFFLLVTVCATLAAAAPQGRGSVRYNPNSDWTSANDRNIKYVHDEPPISPVQRSIGFAGAGSNFVATNSNTNTNPSADYDDEDIKQKVAPTRKAFETTKKPYEKPKPKILTLTASVGASEIQEETTPVNIEVPLRPLVNIKGRPKSFGRAIPSPTSTSTTATSTKTPPSTTSDAEVKEAKETKKPYQNFRGKSTKPVATSSTTAGSKTTVTKAGPVVSTTVIATTTTTATTLATSTADEAVEEIATEAIAIV